MLRFLGVQKADEGAQTLKRKKVKKGTARHSVRNSFKASLGAGIELRSAIRLPPGQDKNEWIAMHTMELYNTFNLVCNFVVEACTAQSCPEMTAGRGVKYLWADETNPKPVDVSAPQYTVNLMAWIDSKFADEELFPMEGEFPKRFESEVRTILKRMFRVYAHIYHSHLTTIKSMGSEAHLNTCFKHFLYFVLEFNLMDPKDLEPMQSFINKLPQDREVARPAPYVPRTPAAGSPLKTAGPVGNSPSGAISNSPSGARLVTAGPTGPGSAAAIARTSSSDTLASKTPATRTPSSETITNKPSLINTTSVTSATAMSPPQSPPSQSKKTPAVAALPGAAQRPTPSATPAVPGTSAKPSPPVSKAGGPVIINKLKK